MKVLVPPQIPQQQQQQQSRLKCGEVYTWDCTGEEYEVVAVECMLCNDRPMCKLSEYAEHMEIWHSQWGQQSLRSPAQSETMSQQQQQQQQQFEPDFMAYDDLVIDGESELLQLIEGHHPLSEERQQLGHGSPNMVQPFERVLITNGWEQVEQTPFLNVSQGAELSMEHPSNEQCAVVEQTAKDSDSDMADEEEDEDEDEDAETEQHNFETPCKSLVGDPTELNANNQIEFGLNEPFTHAKLSFADISHLIALYEAQPRLWNQTHSEFNDRELSRRSWQHIAQQWSAHCGRPFTRKEVHVRIGTLCKRYQKQREMLLQTNGSGGEEIVSGFKHYQQLEFLKEQTPFLTRRASTERNNQKMLEIYQHFPVLWHCDERHVRKGAEARERAYRSISTALSLCGIRLAASAVERRVKTLRQRYRAERIRRIEAQTFETSFRYYGLMGFLDEHIEPYVCSNCGKIFQHIVSYREHKRLGKECEQVNKRVADTQLPTEKTVGELTEDSGFAADSSSDLTASPTSIKLHSREATPSESCGSELMVKVDCGPYSYDLNLADNSSSSSGSFISNETESCMQNTTFARLTLDETRQLIALYRQYPQLWDPHDERHNVRKARSLAWRSLATKINRKCGKRYQWRNIQRKITDFVKYYKRERQRAGEGGSKWYFYADFRFIDKVKQLSTSSQTKDARSVQHKAHNLKIIEIYRTYPQLWNTQHADYSKRKERQRHFALMCARLQADAKIQISANQLKQRLIEFRCNYRLEKQQRVAAAQHKEPYSSHYELYEELHFLDAHVAPFQCAACNMTFKKLSEYAQHKRLQHTSEKQAPQRRRASLRKASNNACYLENVCHICGLTFTLRNNLVYHLKRHLGERQHACSMCPKHFYNTTSLRVHERSHTKECPYVCEQCGHTFVNASKLNQHRKRKHLQQRDYACEKCEKTFYTAFELDRHERRHLNIRDKVCPICGRAFFVGSSYYAHMRLHSDVKHYACPVCHLKFAQYAGLYKHKKRHHPNE